MKDTTRQTEPLGVASLSLLETGERAISWWLGELRAMVPSALLARAPSRLNCPVNIFLDQSGTLTVQAPDGETRFYAGEAEAFAAHLAVLGRIKALKVRLDIPRSHCLIRTSAMPKRALRSARQLLTAETAENTPLSPDAAYWDWFIEGEDTESGNLLLRQVIVGRDRLAELNARIEAAGLKLAHLTVGHGDGRPLPVDLLVSEEPGLRGLLRSLSWPARFLWVASLLVVVSLPSLLNDRADRKLAELQGERMQVMAALQSRPVREPDAIDLATDMRAAPSMAALLDDISQRLPKNAVLQSVSQSGNMLTLHMSAGDPDQMRRAFANAPLFEPLPGGDAGSFKLILKLTVASRGLAP